MVGAQLVHTADLLRDVGRLRAAAVRPVGESAQQGEITCAPAPTAGKQASGVAGMFAAADSTGGRRMTRSFARRTKFPCRTGAASVRWSGRDPIRGGEPREDRNPKGAPRRVHGRAIAVAVVGSASPRHSRKAL